jgi:acyl carrier protein
MEPTVLDRVTRAIVETTGMQADAAQQLGAATPLIGAGLSLDSVAVLELVVALEKEFRIEINSDELLKARALRTVGALAEFVQLKVKTPR